MNTAQEHMSMNTAQEHTTSCARNLAITYFAWHKAACNAPICSTLQFWMASSTSCQLTEGPEFLYRMEWMLPVKSSSLRFVSALVTSSRCWSKFGVGRSCLSGADELCCVLSGWARFLGWVPGVPPARCCTVTNEKMDSCDRSASAAAFVFLFPPMLLRVRKICCRCGRCGLLPVWLAAVPL